MFRYCQQYIIDDLRKKMVFIGGPRQVGKTTLSRAIRDTMYPTGEYYNWDVDEDRQAIRQKQWKQSSPLIIFDELHKYPRWKQWIKGVYDARPLTQQYLVTGSARLDVYRRGGDSLLGRYHYWRLHPLTLDEIPVGITPDDAYKRLLNVGGFPEPFLDNDAREARRWRRERFDRVLREDIRELESIRNIQMLDFFVDELRARVASPVVLNNIARDLEISPKTAKHWLELTQRMYITFIVRPLVRNIPRAILKPPKVYFFDNADTLDEQGVRLENLVASMLLKRLHFQEDHKGYRYRLHYIRDKDGREVDFAITKNGAVETLIEVKLADTNPSSSLLYYANKLKPAQVIQIVGQLTRRCYHDKGVLITNPIDFAQEHIW